MIAPQGDKKGQRMANGGKKHGVALFVLLLLVIILIASIAIFASRDKGPEQSNEATKPNMIAEVAPAALVPVQEIQPAVTNVKKRVITPEEQKKLRPGDEGFDPAAHPTILVMKPKEKQEENLPYRNATEQALLWIMNCEPGDAPLPLLALPQGDMKRMAEILMDKCELEEGDSEWTKEQREQLRYAKEEMRKYIKDGGDPNSFLKYYHDQLEAMHLERSIALDSVMTLLREGGNDDIAEDYLKTVNKRLLDKGIKPIQLSRKKLERHGIKSNHDTPEEEQEK